MNAERGERRGHKEALKLNSPFLFMVQGLCSHLGGAAAAMGGMQRLHSGSGNISTKVKSPIKEFDTQTFQTRSCLFIKQKCTFRTDRQGCICVSTATDLLYRTWRMYCVRARAYSMFFNSPPLYSWTGLQPFITRHTTIEREMFSSSGDDAAWKWIRRRVNT